jgi:hypothetical protein
MPRRTVEAIVALVAVASLALVLLNATLVDRRPPSVVRISLSATANGDDHTAQTLTAIDVEFSEPVDRASVERLFRIEPYVSGTITWDRDTVAIFTPARKLPSATAFAVVVSAGYTDLAGNAAASDAGPFVFQTLGPPVVAATAPASGAVGVATDAAVTLTFDRLMDTGSVEAALAVRPAVAYRSSWAGPDLTLTFASPLDFGTTYSVTVGDAAADTDGSHILAPFGTSFTTVQAGLAIRATVPAAGTAGIGIRTPLAVLFDGTIDPTSVVGALHITPEVSGDVRVEELPADAAVTGSTLASGAPSSAPPGPAGAGTVLVFVPSGPLAPHTTYTIELGPVVRRAGSPGQVAPGRTWAFTTGGPSTSAQNQISFLSSRSGIRNVWLMNPDGSNPRQITTELAPVGEYDVSSDGRTIVYESAGVVTRMRLDGSDAAPITAPGRFEYGPVLSPDGTEVLVGRRDATGADLGFWLVPLPSAPAGTRERQVALDGAPGLGSATLLGDGLVAGDRAGVSSWSRHAAFDPTGRWLLLVDALGRVLRMDLGDAAISAAPEDLGLTAPLAPPAWAAAQGAFLLTAHGAMGNGLIRIPPTASISLVFPAAGPAAVASDGGIVTLAAPAGAHVCYSAAGANTPQSLTSAIDLADRSPTFSPDGTTLLFGRVFVAVPDRSAGIWLSRLDGSVLRQLSTDGADARWLP